MRHVTFDTSVRPALPAARESEWRGVTRRVRAVATLAAVAATAGCYTYTPLVSAPEPGTRVEMTLTDRGRAATTDSLGPSADRIEGTIRSRTDSAMLVAISSVRYFTGQTTRWNGEPLNLNLSSVRTMRERRFSRSRTSLVAGSAVAVVVGFIATRTFGKDGKDKIGDPTTGTPPPNDQ